jgi:phospholipid/cholesterol/gamma-HCH transport system substrate-binding protein
MRKIAVIRLLGWLSALVLVLGVYAVTSIRRQRAAETYTVTAFFTKTIGLFPESDVRVLGVRIGDVRSVEPVGDRVKVVMDLALSRKIPADATAEIIPISLISDRYIQLSPVYESGPTLKDGDVLDVDRTAIPAELDDVLASLQKFLEAVEAGTRDDPGALGAAVRNAAAALEGTGGNLDQTLGSLGDISGAVTAEAARLDSLIVHLNNLLLALSERRSEITRVNTGLAVSIGALAEQQSALDGTLTNLALITEQLGSIVQQHRASLETDFEILSRTTQMVVRHQDSLVRSNDWLHVLADGLEESHNGGATHTVGGLTHIDVRDAHTDCPVAIPELCSALGLPLSAQSQVSPQAEPSVPPAEPSDEPTSENSPSPTPLPSLPEPPDAPLDPELPDLPPAGAAGTSGLGSPVERIGFAERATDWLGRIAASFYRWVEALI